MQHFVLGCSVPPNVIKWNHFKWKIITILDITIWVCLSKLRKIKNNIVEWGETWFDQRFEHFMKKSWKESSTIKCDGWTSVDNRPLLNILFVCPKGDYFFVGSWHRWQDWKWQPSLLTQFVKHLKKSGKYRCCASGD